MKVVTVIGARPQFIKAAAVSRAILSGGSGSLHEVIVHTGQHFDDQMSGIFFREMHLPAPAYELGIGGLSHGAMTGRMLEEIEKVFVAERPDSVLVYGDTNSTLAGALAAAKLRIPVAHIEAGLRSFNRAMPEEVNRVLTDHVSEILFAPTRTAVNNLLHEGCRAETIEMVGDVMYDATLLFAKLAEERSDILSALQAAPQSYVLATVHRAENTDDPARLGAIFDALSTLASEVPVVLPLHPRTRGALQKLGRNVSRPGLHVIEPVGFLDMVKLERNARLIVTDSGGVQKEAYFHRVPCVTLRDETEWVELVEAGVNRLVPPADAEAVLLGIRAMLKTAPDFRRETELYGDGTAANKIVRKLLA
jgi:UDP-GlcNAc3NAcA epimerase